MKPRVVVTGIGAVMSLGDSIGEIWGNIINGKSGVSELPEDFFRSYDYPVKIAAMVRDFDPEEYGINKPERKDIFSQFALAAADMAVEDSGIEFKDENNNASVIIGTGMGGLTTIDNQAIILMNKGPGRVSPRFVSMVIPDAASTEVAKVYNLNGPCYATISACASGADAIIAAYKELILGEADIAVTGGADSVLTSLAVAGFGQARALYREKDYEPEKASRPFDKDRNGFVIAEGAAILILEKLEHAKKRNAKIYAEVLSYGQSCDAYHETAPNPKAVQTSRAIIQAIKKANISPEDIDYINAHGTSTKLNDPMETLAIKMALGDHAYKVPISSTKSMTGHLLGAAGSLEAIISILAINNNTIPPTINYETPDPECDLNYTPNTPLEKQVNIAVSNSFGFGGHNSVLVLKKFE